MPGVSGDYLVTFFPGVALLGCGMALSVAPLTTAVLGAVERRHSGVASGVNTAVARTAGLLAVAAAGLVAQGVFAGPPEVRVAAFRQALAGDAALALVASVAAFATLGRATK